VGRDEDVAHARGPVVTGWRWSTVRRSAMPMGLAWR
jgi:hypothetical protein